MDEQTIKEWEWIEKIAASAVREAREKNKKMGLPNVYSKNKIIYYELPDGRIMNQEQLCHYAKTEDPNLLFLCK